MPIKEAYTAYDGYQGVLACDTHTKPIQLDDGMFAKGVNISVRGGVASTRQGFRDLGDLGTGEFQGAAIYSLDEADHLVYALSGKIKVRDSSGAIHEIAGSLSASGPVYFTQVYRWMVCQDGASRPIVVGESGGSFSRLLRDAVSDAPAPAPSICLAPGSVGAYAHGRYHYVPSKIPELLPELALNADGTEYTNLDVVPELSEESGKASLISTDVLDNLDPYTVFRLSEHRVLNEGGAFSLPAELGFIHAMGSMRGAATGTGVGALFVFGTRGVAAFDFSAPRSEWKNVATGQVAFVGAGTRSPRGVFNVNDDLWYLGTGGHLRSVNYDRAQLSSGSSSGSLSNTVKSIEASRWVAMNSKAWIPSASACVADNRIHFTVADGRALGSVELAQAYNANPSQLGILHEGIYTGFEFLQALSVDDVLHVVVRSGKSVRLLALGGETDPGGVPIRSEFVGRFMPFVYNEASAYRETKRLIEAKLYVSGVDRGTRFEVFYRADHSAGWTSLGESFVNVPAGSHPQSRILSFVPDMTTADGCNPVTGSPPWMFHWLQIRVVFTGRASLDRIVVGASIQNELPSPACESDNPEDVSVPAPAEDDFSYSVPLGGQT